MTTNGTMTTINLPIGILVKSRFPIRTTSILANLAPKKVLPLWVIPSNRFASTGKLPRVGIEFLQVGLLRKCFRNWYLTPKGWVKEDDKPRKCRMCFLFGLLMGEKRELLIDIIGGAMNECP